MKDLIKLILFILITSTIFLIHDHNLLIILNLTVLCLLIFSKIGLYETLIFLKRLSVFLIIVIVFNLLLSGISETALILLRLLFVLSSVLIFSYKFNTTNLINALTVIKLKKEMLLMVIISLNFLKIAESSLKYIKISLSQKGMKLHLRNAISYTRIFLNKYFDYILNYIYEIEMNLLSKGINKV